MKKDKGNDMGAAEQPGCAADNCNRLEEELRKSREQYHMLFDRNPNPMLVYELGSLKFLAVNDTAVDRYGYSRDEFLGKTLKDIHVEEDFDSLLESASGIKGDISYKGVWRHRKKDGVVIFADIVSYPISFEGKKAAFMMSLDVTARKQAELAVRMSEQRFRAIADYTFGWENWISPRGKLLWVNQAVERISGYTPKECMRMSDYPVPLVVEEDKAKVAGALTEAVNGSWAKDFEFRIQHKNGSVRWLSASWQPIYDNKGAYQGYRSSFRDVTDHRKAEEQLRVSEENYRAIFDGANDAIFVHDIETGAIVDFNQKVYEMFGYGQEETEQIDVGTLSSGEAPYRKLDVLRRIHLAAKGEAQLFEWQARHKDGHLFWIEVNLKKTMIGGKEQLLSIVRDITSRKEVEEKLEELLTTLALKNKELESILRVTSYDLWTAMVDIEGFSHELSVNWSMLKEALEQTGVAEQLGAKASEVLDRGIPEALEYILAGTKKTDSLLAGLLKLSRLGTESIEIEHLDMNTVLVEVAAEMDDRLKATGAKLELEKLEMCYGDRSHIGQVFMNLLDNAARYLNNERAGVIRVWSKAEGDKSVYCVEDNGKGIASEDQEKIFEIFSQLESDDRNAGGLGLALVRRIVERHNGRIWVESEVGKGSKFFVSLPNV